MFKRAQHEIMLEKLIEKHIFELDTYDPSAEEAVAIVEALEKLHRLNTSNRPFTQVSPDTLALIAANFIGIVMILKYERVNIITSKAMNLVLKPR